MHRCESPKSRKYSLFLKVRISSSPQMPHDRRSRCCRHCSLATGLDSLRLPEHFAALSSRLSSVCLVQHFFTVCPNVFAERSLMKLALVIESFGCFFSLHRYHLASLSLNVLICQPIHDVCDRNFALSIAKLRTTFSLLLKDCAIGRLPRLHSPSWQPCS